MNKIVKSLSSILLVILSLMLIQTVSFSQPEQRVLLEQFTGAWCGWCPDGTVYLDSLIQKYPGKVIGAKIHYGDAMETAETYQLNYAYVISIAGWPSGAINRQYVYEWFIPDSAIALDRGIWDSVVAAELQKPPVVDVSLYYNIDPVTRKLTATVSGKFLAELNGDFRFNAYITEDDVTGTGSSYDQINNFSHNSQYPNHPYYNQPSVIKGYKHQKVLRKMLGGPWGTGGAIPKHVVTGDYCLQNYEYDLDTTWNIDKLSLIGFVQQNDIDTNNRQILNSVIGQKADITTRIIPPNPDNAAMGANETFETSFKADNVSTTQRTFMAGVYKSLRTPEDWTAQIINFPNEFTLMPGDIITIRFSLTPGATVGIGDATVFIREKDNNNSLAYGTTITVLSREIEKVNVYDDDDRIVSGFFSITYHLKEAGRNDFIDVPSNVFTRNIDQLNNLKTVSWNCGEFGDFSLDEAKTLEKVVDNNANLLLSGTIWIDGLNTNYPALLEKMGISRGADCFQGYKDGQLYISGYTGDPISDNIFVKAHLMAFYTMGQKITGSNTYPVLKHRYTDTVIASRTQMEKSRLVLISLNPGLIDTLKVESNLIKKSLDWLEGVTDVPEPVLNNKSGISLEVSQNPIIDKAVLYYNFEGNQTVQFELYLSDIFGRKIQILETRQIPPGEHEVEINSHNLISGTYFIIATAGKEHAVLPVMIVK